MCLPFLHRSCKAGAVAKPAHVSRCQSIREMEERSSVRSEVPLNDRNGEIDVEAACELLHHPS
jgi:hypothetical protein